MIGGANDGSIHIWQERKVYSKPDLLIRTAHPIGTLVTSVMTSSTGWVIRTSNYYFLFTCLDDGDKSRNLKLKFHSQSFDTLLHFTLKPDIF